MGLFKKRQQTQEELEAMRSEMRSLRDHLEKTDAVKNELAERVGRLDAENQRLNAQVGTVEARVGEVAEHVGSVEHEVVTVAGSIGPTVDQALKTVSASAASTDDVEGLRNEVRSLGALAQQGAVPDDGSLTDLRSKLEALNAALEEQRGQLADLVLVATDTAERSALTESRIASMSAPDDWAPLDGSPSPDEAEAKRQLGQLAEKVASLDSRVNQVSLELTNQLTELSSDLDRVGTQGDSSELIDQINSQLDDITGGQERLANEQARYAIQFRSDLADLADRLKRK